MSEKAKMIKKRRDAHEVIKAMQERIEKLESSMQASKKEKTWDAQQKLNSVFQKPIKFMSKNAVLS